MVQSAPKVVSLTVDLHENFVEMLQPEARAHHTDPVFPDLALEHWAEPSPPKSNYFMAYLDAPFMQKILYVSQ
jgi:hypothetical protein